MQGTGVNLIHVNSAQLRSGFGCMVDVTSAAQTAKEGGAIVSILVTVGIASKNGLPCNYLLTVHIHAYSMDLISMSSCRWITTVIGK